MRIRSTLVSVAVLLLAGGAHAELVTNGGFEDRFNEYDAPGWSIEAGTGTVSFAKVSEYFTCCTLSGTYPNGNDTGAAFFGWDNLQGGDLGQVLTTVAGQRYTVSFDSTMGQSKGQSAILLRKVSVYRYSATWMNWRGSM